MIVDSRQVQRYAEERKCIYCEKPVADTCFSKWHHDNLYDCVDNLRAQVAAMLPDCILAALRRGDTEADFVPSGVMREDIIEDGYGSRWFRRCAQCGKDSMQVVRPGKVQCEYCG